MKNRGKDRERNVKIIQYVINNYQQSVFYYTILILFLLYKKDKKKMIMYMYIGIYM